jgi:hypothetical protein
VICLRAGNYPLLTLQSEPESGPVAVRSAPGARAVVAGILLDDASNLLIQGLTLTKPLQVKGESHDLKLIGNDIGNTVSGMYFQGDWDAQPVHDVEIVGNRIHDIDYPEAGGQGVGYGYGIEALGNVEDFTIRANTITSVGADYIQTGRCEGFDVVGNRFTGPSLRYTHPMEHADLWQCFSASSRITFRGNVVDAPGTNQTLLFKNDGDRGVFRDVTIEDNLFVRGSDGYVFQLGNADGLVVRRNTLVDSRWGLLLRDYPEQPAPQRYAIEHNVVVATKDGKDYECQGRACAPAGSVQRFNVSSDDSAPGVDVLHDWAPSWLDARAYLAKGLPFKAGRGS